MIKRLILYLKVQLKGKLDVEIVMKFYLGCWGHSFAMNSSHKLSKMLEV